MVRPFDLRDLALIRRLGERGVSLHAISALAENFHPLRSALVSMLIGGEFPTFVSRPENGQQAGFIQLRIAPSGSQAHILYLSPGCEPSTAGDGSDVLSALHAPECAVWLALLDEAVYGLGQRGVQHVIAEVDEHSDELVVLRRAGFAVYTRQDVWAVEAMTYRPQSVGDCHLSRRQSTDDWDIQLLYANTVPRLVQLVEPMPPMEEGENWVVREGGDLAAFVNVRKGSVATWLRFFIHPDAEAEAGEIIAAALEVAFADGPSRVFCCVRRYESWLTTTLEQSGFAVACSQAVMVRHTVHHLPRAVPEMAGALERQRIPASSQIVRNYQRPESNGHS